MRKINVLMLSVFFVALSLNLNAQTRSRLSKVGAVDVNAINSTVLEDKNLLGKIEAKFDADSKNFDALEAEIKKTNADIATLRKDIAKAEDTAAVEKEIAALEKKLAGLDDQHKKQAPTISMRKSKKNQAVQAEVYRYIVSAIMVIVRREGYTAIIQKNETVIFVDKEFDLTSQVMASVRASINAIK